MKPIIFVRVADMKYYQGISDKDAPYNGGAYVEETGMAHECFNFDPIVEDGEDTEKCIGFFMMIGGNGACQLHIEKMPGCEYMKKEEQIDDAIVVFVSKARDSKNMRVAGFYRNATVFRYPHYMNFEDGYQQEYMFEANKEDCVVLPYTTRFSDSSWYVPSSTSKYSDFGFGRSNVWFAGGKGASDQEKEYVERMISSVESYNGENWMGKGGEA